MQKDLFAPRDLTVGVPWKGIVWFTLPMLIGNIAQQLYNTVDSIVVGHAIGDEALAAVGSAGPILNLLLVLFIGISAGVNIMVAQYYGAKERSRLSYTVGNALTVTAVCCLFLMIAATPLIEPILELLNTPHTSIEKIDSTIFDECASYLKISVIGIVGMAFYNILSGILRGLGDSFSSLIYLLIATVLNIGLDLLFVLEFDMGVGGVALATVIAQCVSSLLCMIKLAGMKTHFDFGMRFMRPKLYFVKMIAKLGLPAGLTQAIMSSAMIVVQSLTNQFGGHFIAANVVVMRVDGFAMMPNFSFGMAMTTFAGQNIGAGKLDRVIKGARQGTLMGLGCSAAITGTILLFGESLMGIFTETDSLVSLSYKIMCLLAAGYLAMAITQCLSGIMRGAGDTMTPMWISLITTVLVRVPLAYGIEYFTRADGAALGSFWCIPGSLLASWVLGALLTLIFYSRGKWKTKSLS